MSHRQSKSEKTVPTQTYDYVIVGAGSAGCVLASRLTEAPDTEVALLEAGTPDEQREISIPAAFAELFKSDIDWEYYTDPQPSLNGRELYWPRGKTLGGSSSMNAMIHVRGHPHDYDRWASLGNDGWSYEDVLPYFKRAEHNERLTSDYHGTDGPLHVAELQAPNQLSEAFVDAGAEIGLPRNDDFNSPPQEGIGLYQVTQKDGERHSVADAYLKPALDRSNLTTETNAQVTRIRFDGQRAIGVEYDHNGTRVHVDANEEVLVCAGAVNSPQLLLLSGIGPSDHLRKHGIDVIADVPGVGQNLQDHLLFPVTYACERPVTLDDADSIWNLLKYLLFKTGPLTSNVGEAGGFIRTDPERPAPDLQLHFGPCYFLRHGFDNPEGHGFTVAPTLIRPKSRGQISLRSANPFEEPSIDPNYLADEADLSVLIEGTKIAREIAQATPFDEYRGGELVPGPDARTDEEIASVIRDRVQSLYHPVGTCKMGNDSMAVVDDRLRVHGVAGLRVVDASIMPTIPGGNTNAPTIMIAEKAADLVSEESDRAAELTWTQTASPRENHPPAFNSDSK